MVEAVGGKYEELKNAIEPSIMAKQYGVRPDRSAYYLAHGDDQSYVAQFDIHNAVLITIYGAQRLYRDEINEIEMIKADTFDDSDDPTNDF